jgi:hypothetical protein
VAPLPGGAFAVAGARGIESVGRFQVFVQRLDGTGAPTQDTIDVGREAEVTQQTPAMGADGAGALYPSWLRTPDVGDDQVMRAVIEAGGGSIAAGPTAADGGAEAGGPAADPAAEDGGGYAAWWRASGAGYQISVHPAAHLDAASAALQLGQNGSYDHSPAVAAGGDGGAVAWLRVVSGTSNDLLLSAFADDGSGALTAGEVVTVETEPAALPYPPSLTHVAGGVWFVVWTEGVYPDYILRGRFADLQQ